MLTYCVSFILAYCVLSVLSCRYWKCDIPGAPEGLLKGKRVAIKDNVCVAVVPLMNGSKVMKGYTPEVDATIVTRILDAGKLTWMTLNNGMILNDYFFICRQC